MTPEQARDFPYDSFDVTKVWPHAAVPPIVIGRLVLDKNPVNYFAEVEQSAFNPSNFVPGIAASPDKMLQGRLFSYHDTHLHRLGANYQLLPINAPKNAPVRNYQRDGAMRASTSPSSSIITRRLEMTRLAGYRMRSKPNRPMREAMDLMRLRMSSWVRLI